MPQNEIIDIFNQELIKTGNEPEIAQEKGEEIEPVLRPEEYPMDHNGPLTRKPKATPKATETSANSPAPSLDDLFSSFESDTNTSDSPESALGSQDSTNSFNDLFDNDLFDSIAPETTSIDPDSSFDPMADLSDLSDTIEQANQNNQFNIPDPESFNYDSLQSEQNISPDENLDKDSIADSIPVSEPETDFDFGDVSTTSEAIEESTDTADIDNFLDSFESGLEEPETEPTNTPEPDLPSMPDFDQIDDIGEMSDLADMSDLGDFSEPQNNDAIPEMPSFDAPADTIDDFGMADFSLNDEPPIAEALNDDDFATMDFEAPIDSSSAATAEPSEAMPDFSTDLDADFGTDSFPEEFSMGDFEKEFGVVDSIPAEDWKAPLAAAAEEDVEEAAKASASDEAKDYKISDADFRNILDCLAAMPLNLKIATEEVLGNPDKPFKELQALIEALIRGESPATIAPMVSRLLGKKIKIPPGYQKKTGRAFEEERNSFAYLFKTNFLPIFRTVLLAVVGIVLVGWLVIRFIVTPLQAYSLYEQGLQAISRSEYNLGNQHFDSAYKLWPENDRFIQYADAFTKMQELERAYAKYRQLLGDIDPRVLPPNLPEDIRDFHIQRHAALSKSGSKEKLFLGAEPLHQKGILSFANFLYRHYAPPAGLHENRYAEAVIYLERLVVQIPRSDPAAMELQGDIYLTWARYLDDPTKPSPAEDILKSTEFYTANPIEGLDQELSTNQTAPDKVKLARLVIILEGARLSYARLVEQQGLTEYLSSKMLDYFITAGKHEQVAPILAKYLAKEKLNVDPKVISRLAGVIIDQAQDNVGQVEKAHHLIKMAIDAGSDYSGLYYQLARYYRYLRNNQQEEDILKNARLAFKSEEAISPFDRWELQQYIDTLIRSAEIAIDLKKAIAANDFLDEAQKRYEEAILSRKIPARSPIFGRLYALQADQIFFRDVFQLLPPQDLEKSLNLYQLAKKNQYGLSPLNTNFNRPKPNLEHLWTAYQEISYKAGYIYYYLALGQSTSANSRANLIQLAAEEFIHAQGRVASQNPRLRLALANSYSEMGNYEAAIAEYRLLYDQLAYSRSSLGYFDPRKDSADRELLELIHACSNNLGVTCYRAYRNGGAGAETYLSQAQTFLSEATTIAQDFDRAEETGIAAESIRASYLNMDRVLAAVDRDDLYLIPGIARTLESNDKRRN